MYPPAYGSGPATVTGYTPHMGYQLANQQGYSPATGYPPSGAAPSHYGDYSQAQPPANQNIPWTPTPQESSIIEKWFRSLDKGNTGQVGGLDVAKFLKRTELPRELLRDMWTLVDDQKCGSVDFRQFTVFVRLISLACSPTFTGQQVSISLYFSTSRVYVPLPSTLLSWGVDSSAAASVTLPVQQTPHSNLQEIEDEDFTDFAGAEPQTEQKAPYVEIDLLTLDDEPQLNGPLQISVEETAPQTTAQLAENNDDDFSEFTGAETVSSPPITSIADAICGAVMQPKLEAAIANPSVPDTRIGQEITIGELDDPGSLASPISAKRLNISGSNSSATSVNPVATAEIDDDDFTEFSGHLSQAGSITCPIVDTGTNSATNSVSMPMSAPPPMNNTMQSSNHLSAFDELVENDLKALEEEWDDFADATKASESIPQETITTEDKLSNPTVNNSIEKENPFNESVEDTHTEKLMELAGTGGIDNNGEAIENDDEFGDFEEHPISFDAVFTADNLEEKEVATPLDDPFIGIEGDQEVALERSPREDDAEEDFGNFESHPNENKAEVPAKEPEVEIDLLMLDDNDANLGLFTSASTKHFTPKTQQEIDLLDFLSEPMFDSAAPTTTLQPSTDFFAATSSGLPDQPSSIQNNSQPSKALTGNDDLDTEDEWTDFNDFSPEEKSGDGDPVRAPETIVAVSPSVNPNIPDDNISAAYSTASVATVSKLDESKVSAMNISVVNCLYCVILVPSIYFLDTIFHLSSEETK